MALVVLLFFLSGSVALVYEVFWMKALSLLLGNTAGAAAATLAAFFSGLAAGSRHWGRLVRSRPLFAYGLLEIAAALAASGYFLIPAAHRWLYPRLFAAFESDPWLLLALKFALALIALFPAAFFLGGTLPALSLWAAQGSRSWGRRATLLYAANTLGAAAGAWSAGCCLPVWLGYRQAYSGAMAVGLMIGGTALWLGRKSRSADGFAAPDARPEIPLDVAVLAFLSGFATLALQVLWTRMFAQVVQNSVQTFALVLTAFLLFLALGALLARWSMRFRLAPGEGLFAALVAAGAGVLLTPFVFLDATEGLQYVGQGLGFTAYLRHLLVLAATVLGPALLASGLVFPLILKRAEAVAGAGAVGPLAAVNTAGAIAGALAAGFLLFEAMGLWSSIRFIGVLYFIAALGLLLRDAALSRAWALLPLAGMLLAVSVWDVSGLPTARVDPVNEDESLLRVWEDGAATVAVIRRGQQRQIKVDNHYTLGGTGSAAEEARQGSLPVLLHPRPDSVYVLGLGTGITAGAVLRHPVERLVVAELLPSVITASREYFSGDNFGLFHDRRAKILAEDGRNHIATTSGRFDVVVADLFVPWQAGTGSLYTLEHFRAVRDHLAPGGLFMQWLPAYQLSADEFAVIAHTLLAVFPQVTLWRGDFSVRTPVLGLLAQAEPAPLSPHALLFAPAQAEYGGTRLLTHYVGRLAPRRVESSPLNRDDRPLIEYGSPVTQRQEKRDRAAWLTGERLITLMAAVRGEDDGGFLRDLPPSYRTLPEAGLCLHRARVYKQEGYLERAKREVGCDRAAIRAMGGE